MTCEQVSVNGHKSNYQIAGRQITGKLRKDFETQLAHHVHAAVAVSLSDDIESNVLSEETSDCAGTYSCPYSYPKMWSTVGD